MSFGGEQLKPAIINSSLSELKQEKLLRVLRKNKIALGLSIKDLKGINIAYCMHIIKLELMSRKSMFILIS